MAREGWAPPAIGVTDSLRPMALDAMRDGERRNGRPSSESRPRGRAWFVLWFFGAAVFSFSTMAALERHGLSQLLMPAAPPPAEVSVIEEPIAFSAIRHARAFDDVLASPWRHREHDAAPATTTATSAPAAVATTATSASAAVASATKKTESASASATKKTESPSASPPPAIVAPKREASSKPVAPARTASAPVAPPANAASASGSDEVAAAAAMLEKAKGEHALE